MHETSQGNAMLRNCNDEFADSFQMKEYDFRSQQMPNDFHMPNLPILFPNPYLNFQFHSGFNVHSCCQMAASNNNTNLFINNNNYMPIPSPLLNFQTNNDIYKICQGCGGPLAIGHVHLRQ